MKISIVRESAKMKGLLLVFAVLATCCYASQIGKQFSEKVRGAWDKCKNKVSDDAYARLTEKMERAESYDEKCFKHCFSEKMGFMSGNTVNKATLLEANKEQWPNELTKANEMIETCYKESGKQTDPCLTAGDFCDCMRRYIGENNLSFPTLYPKA